MNNKIIVISGPTASGKSALALNFSLENGNSDKFSIINADSLQIYHGLPILSSQPTKEEQQKVPHFLYSTFNPDETSSVGAWLRLVKNTVEKSWEEGKTPIIVGGSGMYISKLIDGICEIPEISDDIREGSRELFEQIGIEEFREKLLNLDKDNLSEEEIKSQKSKIAQLDKQRLIRRYEVLQQTGKSLAWWQNQSNKVLFDEKIITHINLNPDRDELYKNCNLRFELMLENGAIDEVENLLELDLEENSAIYNTLGFTQIVDFLNGEISEDEAVKIASQKTRNYAKRQLTWFRNQLPNKETFSNPKQALDFLRKLPKNS